LRHIKSLVGTQNNGHYLQTPAACNVATSLHATESGVMPHHAASNVFLPRRRAPARRCLACPDGPRARRILSDRKRDATGDGTLNPVLRMAAGAAAGIVAMSSTYHLDMVRGRLTCQEGQTNQQYRGILHAYREIIAQVRPRSAPA
jgi:Mitochondrial carrier protein